MRVLIVGYGNPLRGDDGVGPEIARRLGAELQDPDIEILTELQPRPELAELMSQSQLTIFIDASAESQPGEIRVEEVRPPETPHQRFTHQFAPPMLLTTAKVLYGRIPRTYLVSIGGERFELSEGLSDAVHQAIPKAIEAVRRLATPDGCLPAPDALS
ncbi:MAG TPA: hydrogenase maturation protease [Acidobacteriota bacterium]|nr:hydrogenase maturation protease [Acidobacteriota bacterium]